MAVAWAGAVVESKIADRSRIVKARYESGRNDKFHDNGRPIEGPSYRSTRFDAEADVMKRFQAEQKKKNARKAQKKPAPWKMEAARSAGQSYRWRRGGW